MPFQLEKLLTFKTENNTAQNMQCLLKPIADLLKQKFKHKLFYKLLSCNLGHTQSISLCTFLCDLNQVGSNVKQGTSHNNKPLQETDSI